MVVHMNGTELLVGFSREQSGPFAWELGRKVKRSNTLCCEPLDALAFFSFAPILRRQDQSNR